MPAPETIAYYVPQPDGSMVVVVLPAFYVLVLERGDFIELEPNGQPDEDGRIPLREKMG